MSFHFEYNGKRYHALTIKFPTTIEIDGVVLEFKDASGSYTIINKE